MVAALDNDPAYVLFDYEAQKADTSMLMKQCFITYSPDSCTSMAKKLALQNYKASVKSATSATKEM